MGLAGIIALQPEIKGITPPRLSPRWVSPAKALRELNTELAKYGDMVVTKINFDAQTCLIRKHADERVKHIRKMKTRKKGCEIDINGVISDWRSFMAICAKIERLYWEFMDNCGESVSDRALAVRLGRVSGVHHSRLYHQFRALRFPPKSAWQTLKAMQRLKELGWQG